MCIYNYTCSMHYVKTFQQISFGKSLLRHLFLLPCRVKRTPINLSFKFKRLVFFLLYTISLQNVPKVVKLSQENSISMSLNTSTHVCNCISLVVLWLFDMLHKTPIMLGLLVIWRVMFLAKYVALQGVCWEFIEKSKGIKSVSTW